MSPRKGRAGPIVTLAIGEAPAVIRETMRVQLTSHRLALVTTRPEHSDPGHVAVVAVLTDEALERFLRDVANNVAQALFSLELGDD